MTYTAPHPPDHPDYLWDRSGPVDPEIQRLERLLAGFRHTRPAPTADTLALPAPTAIHFRPTPTRPGRTRLAAAAIVLLTGLAALLAHRPDPGLPVRAIAGSPRIGHHALTDAGRLRPGRWLQTDDRSAALLQIGDLGEVRVEPGTRVRIRPGAGRQRRLDLQQGALYARITAPPRLFIVETPTARAVDMGCEYRLEVAPDGAGLLRVTLGWVYLEDGGRESRVPMDGGLCRLLPGRGPGTPFFEDAPAALKEALTRFDDHASSGALAEILAAARPRDALTLWHLLRRTTGADRAAVYDRLAALKPPPRDLAREAVLALAPAALERWWNHLRPF